MDRQWRTQGPATPSGGGPDTTAVGKAPRVPEIREPDDRCTEPTRSAAPRAPRGAASDGAAGSDSISEVFARSSTGSGELPYRAEMERAVGQDFSGVRVQTGRAHELSQIQARAAASGEGVVFADAQPDRHTVAHELAHV